MAFSLTYQNILDKNIRNIYSDGPPTVTIHRTTKERPKPVSNTDIPARKQLVRTSDYISDHKCFIPKAHAFRSLPPDEIDAIVTRLRKPTAASETSGTPSEALALENNAISSPRFLGLRSVDKAEHDEIIHNLERPTQMSSQRERSKV